METLFGFVSVRPVGPARVFDGVRLESQTEFQQRLAAAQNAESPRAAAVAASEEFLRSESAVTNAGSVAHGQVLVDAVTTLAADIATRAADVVNFLTQRLGNLDTFVASTDFVGGAARVCDTLVAAYLTGGQLEMLQALARGVTLVELAASDALTDERTDAVLRGPIEMPAFVDALRAAAAKPPAQEDPAARAEALAKEIERLRDRSAQIERALAEIQLVQPDEQSVTTRDRRQPLTDLFLQRRLPQGPREGPRPLADLRGAFGSTLLSRASDHQNVMITASALETMPEQTLRTIRSLDIDPSITPVRDLQRTMSGELMNLRTQTLQHASDIFKIGPVADAIAVRLRLQPVDDPIQEDGPWSPAVPVLPTTHGTAKPVGIADLLLVKSQLVRYERGEVARVKVFSPARS